MSVYTDRVDAARNKGGNLFRQIIFAAWKAALDISAEAGTVQFHAARLRWALKIRQGGIDAAEAFAGRVMPQVLMDATILAAPEAADDAAVQAVVDGLVNAWLDKG